jgi:hypothetical protein
MFSVSLIHHSSLLLTLLLVTDFTIATAIPALAPSQNQSRAQSITARSSDGSFWTMLSPFNSADYPEASGTHNVIKAIIVVTSKPSLVFLIQMVLF